MAQSTEDYLDSLLRQAMGIPEPEPQPTPAQDLSRNDVFEMAEGLTGSNSAILGHVYDHNASFTNQGEIEIPATQNIPAAQTVNTPVQETVAPENLPDPDAPVAVSTTNAPSYTENLLPDIDVSTLPENTQASGEVTSSDIIPEAEIIPEGEPVILPEGPIIEPDGNLDIIPEPVMEEISIPDIDSALSDIDALAAQLSDVPVPEEPAAEVPVMEMPSVEVPSIEVPEAEIPAAEAPVMQESEIDAALSDIGALDDLITDVPVTEEPAVEVPSMEIPATEMPSMDIPVADIPAAEAPVMQESEIDASLSDIGALDALITDVPVTEEPAVEVPSMEIPATEMPSMDIPVADIPSAETPVIQESEIDAALSDIGALDDLITDAPVMDELAMEAPSMEIPSVEEPVMEEPAMEVPSMGIPASEVPEVEAPAAEAPEMETPSVEIPAAEEPVQEAGTDAGVSLSDIDLMDNNEALDQDMISALLENASSGEMPSADEPVAEESVPEEPAQEETSGGGISIDDLDPNDSAKSLDPDMIAALFESANVAEESAESETPAESEEPAEEPAADDLSAEGSEASLEELEIPAEEGEETPLMADQEISELLSSLDGLGAESEEKEEADAGTDETASDDSAQSDIALDGIDMFDTDLSAMLDDVNNSLESEGTGEGTAESDADLSDLLGSLDDGSGDLSDIGDLLEKDENSELVDSNSEMAEALFASDSQEELFGIDNLIDEEENPKKKKKKRGLFGKKKKDSNVEVIGQDEEMLVDPDLLDIPDEADIAKKKKPGFFAALFAKLFEEVEEEDETVAIDQSAVEIAQEGAAENEAILSEIDGAEQAEDKKGKKEKKKKEKKKKDKKGAAPEGEEGEEGAEEPKKKKKKEKKEKKKKDDLPDIPGRKLPRKKVVAIALFCITLGIVITFLAFLYPYYQDINKAKKFYSTGEYQKTYEYMRGHKLTSEDQVLYDRTTTLLRIKRPYDSYVNYMKMGLRMEALNALVQGVQMIDRYAEDAASLGITDKYTKQARMIYDELYNSFGVTVDKARSWIELEGSPEYTRALYECLRDTSGIPTEQTPAPVYEEEDDSSVINAEEKDL